MRYHTGCLYKKSPTGAVGYCLVRKQNEFADEAWLRTVWLIGRLCHHRVRHLAICENGSLPMATYSRCCKTCAPDTRDRVTISLCSSFPQVHEGSLAGFTGEAERGWIASNDCRVCGLRRKLYPVSSQGKTFLLPANRR